MSTLTEFYESGRAIDLVIGIVLVELFVFAGLRRWTVVVGLAPGLCLLLALRGAVRDAGWEIVALWVALSLPAHLADLRLRMRRNA